ncbi:MAG: branched-chain amino acid ABC transporter permease [Candidatus Bipolaricaulia bacterium]
MDLSSFLFFQSLISGLFIASVYALVALGLTLIFGVMDIADFAQGALYMLGAYVSFYALDFLGIPYFFTLPLAMLFVGIVAISNNLLVYRPLRRAGGAATFIAALGILLIIQNLALIVFGSDFRILRSPFGEGKLILGEIILTHHKLFVMGATVILILAVWLFLRRTKMGKALRAMSQNRVGAALVGINTNRIAIVTFALAGALAGGAGALISPIRPFDPNIGTLVILKSFAIVIFGGMGSVQGALVGALILGVAETMTAAFLASEFSDLAAFVLLILILLFRPQGLFGGRAA